MKILSIENSKVFGYYMSHECVEMLNKKYQEALASITEIDGELSIRISIDYDPTILGYLKMYLSRVQKVTLGNIYLYEYELNCSATMGDKDFVINTEDQTFTCNMTNVYMSGPDSIVIIFKILK